MNYDRAFDRLIANEGGYANNPADPGGETMWGITIAVARANGYQGAMRDLTRDQAKPIYKARYWDASHCGELDGAIAFQVFDAAVNHGIPEAIELLQYAVGVHVDGQFGAATIGAVRATPIPKVLNRFIAQRLRFYAHLTTFNTFGRGWVRRCADDLDYAAEDI